MGNGQAVKVLSQAQYPKMPKYPSENNEDWEKYCKEIDEWEHTYKNMLSQPVKYTDGVNNFCTRSISAFLLENGGNNIIISPISLFMTLGICAEITNGISRQQILELLDVDCIETLEKHAESIWRACHIDDGVSKSLISGSLWIDNRITVKTDVLKRLSEMYYSSSFSGEMGTTELTDALQKWLSEQTGGMLDNSISRVETYPSDAMVLTSTIDYSGKWSCEFPANRNRNKIFHAVSGDKKCMFMNDKLMQDYYYSDKFSYIDLSFDYNGHMRLILPDAGISPEELIADEKFINAVFSGQDTCDVKAAHNADIELSVPKFDVSSDKELGTGLEKIGIHDIFDPATADFSPLTENENDMFVSSAKQCVRVKIDEKGCKAAAFTIMWAAGCIPPQPGERVEMIFDRPFIFEIVSETGFPLFIGIVNEV